MSTTRTIVIAGGTDGTVRRFTTALEGAGHHTRAIGRAADLLTHIADDREPVDAVLLDLQAAGFSGVEIVKRIRRVDAGRISILVFSGSITSAQDVRDLAALGVSAYVNENAAERHIVASLAPHLFPDNFNRRSSARVTLGIPVGYRSGATIAAAITLNLGKGGLAIRTMSPLESRSRILVRFRLPGSQRELEAESRVAWSSQRVGMGVQFERVDPADQAAIDEFVDRHGARPHDG